MSDRFTWRWDATQSLAENVHTYAILAHVHTHSHAKRRYIERRQAIWAALQKPHARGIRKVAHAVFPEQYRQVLTRERKRQQAARRWRKFAKEQPALAKVLPWAMGGMSIIGALMGCIAREDR